MDKWRGIFVLTQSEFTSFLHWSDVEGELTSVEIVSGYERI